MSADYTPVRRMLPASSIFLLTFFWSLCSIPGLAQPANLDQLEQLVFERNPELVTGMRNVQEIQQKYKSTQSLFPSQPVLRAEYGVGSIFNDPDRALVLGIEQEIDLYGKTGSLKNKGILDIAQARGELEAIRREIRSSLYSTLNNLSAAETQLVISDSLLESAQVLVRTAERRLREGDISPLEANAFAIEFSTAKINQLKKQSEVFSLKSEFVSRFNLTPPSNSAEMMRSKRYALPDTARLAPTIDSIPAVTVARIERDRLQFEKDLTTRDYLQNPSLGITFSKTRFQFDRDEIFGSPSIVNGIDYLRKDERELSFQLSFSLPFSIPYLWEAPRLATIPYDAQISFKQAAYEQTRRSASARLRGLLQSLAFLDSALVSAGQASQIATESYRGFERAYLAGQLSYSDFIANRKALAETLTNEVAIRKEFNDVRIEIESLIGK